MTRRGVAGPGTDTVWPVLASMKGPLWQATDHEGGGMLNSAVTLSMHPDLAGVTRLITAPLPDPVPWVAAVVPVKGQSVPEDWSAGASDSGVEDLVPLEQPAGQRNAESDCRHRVAKHPRAPVRGREIRSGEHGGLHGGCEGRQSCRPRRWQSSRIEGCATSAEIDRCGRCRPSTFGRQWWHPAR